MSDMAEAPPDEVVEKNFAHLTPHMAQELFCRMDTKGRNTVGRHDLTGTVITTVTTLSAVSLTHKPLQRSYEAEFTHTRSGLRGGCLSGFDRASIAQLARKRSTQYLIGRDAHRAKADWLRLSRLWQR